MLPHIPAVAGPDANLTVLGAPHSLHVVPANSTLTFEHTYNWWVKASVPHFPGHSRALDHVYDVAPQWSGAEHRCWVLIQKRPYMCIYQ